MKILLKFDEILTKSWQQVLLSGHAATHGGTGGKALLRGPPEGHDAGRARQLESGKILAKFCQNFAKILSKFRQTLAKFA